MDTARTSGSQDVFVEAKEEIDDVVTPAADTMTGQKGEVRNVSSGSGIVVGSGSGTGTGPRETKFHEEL